MGLKSYREARTSTTTGTDVKGDSPFQIAQQQLIPQIAKRSRNAVKVNRQDFMFFQRKQAGRRCSCFAIEQSPDGGCGVCFGTGFVGGYDKFGCETEIIDVSRPGLRLVGVEPNYEARTRPVLFRLIDGATRGYVECDIELRSNVRLVDIMQLRDSVPDRRNAKVAPMVLAGSTWKPLTDAVLSTMLANQKITVRIEMSRRLVTMDSPQFSHLMMRYRKLENPRVIADVPRRRKSIVLEEFGISDRYEVINLFLADEPRMVATEDFFVLLAEGTRWKVIDESENKPGGILTSHDVTARLINTWESYAQVPL